MAGTTVTLTADESSMLRAFQKIQAAQEKTDQGFKKTKDTAQDSSRHIALDMEAAGNATTKAFNDSLKELRKMGPEGRAAANEVEKHLRETGKAGRKSFEEVLQAIGKIDDETEKVARNATKDFKQVSAAGDQAFGDAAAVKVRQFAAQWLAVSNMVALVKDGLSGVRQEQEGSLRSLMSQGAPEKRLAQVATSGADLDAMISKADQIAMETGMPREQAKQLVFSARSEGFEGDLDMIARGSSVFDASSQAKLIGTLGTAFKSEGLSGEQRMSAILTSASLSKFDAETMGAAVEKSAVAATNAGADMAETMAINAIMANVVGAPAGDRSKAFASQVFMKDDLRGKGFIESVKALRAMSDAERKDLLGGSTEVIEAYSVINNNMAEAESLYAALKTDETETAAGRGTFRQRQSVVEASPRFQERQRVLAAQNRQEIANEREKAAGEARFKAEEATARARATEAGSSPFLGVLGSQLAESARYLGAGPDRAAGASSILAGDDLGRLQRVASAMAQGQGDADDRIILESVALAARQAATGRLNSTAAAGFLGAVSGQPIAAGEISPQQLESVQGLVGTLARQTSRTDEIFALAPVVNGIGAGAVTDRMTGQTEQVVGALIAEIRGLRQEMQGVRQNTSQTPTISGSQLQNPVAASAAP